MPVHSAVEMFAAPAIMAAPFLLGFGVAAATITVVFGALLLGLAIQVEGSGSTVSLTAHEAFDYTLAVLVSVGGLAVGLATGDWLAASFLVGVGAAQIALTAATRFSVSRSA